MGEVVIAQNEVVNAKTVEIAKTKLQMTKRSCNCKNEVEIFLSAEAPHMQVPLRWCPSRCARDCRCSNKVNLSRDNLTLGGR